MKFNLKNRLKFIVPEWDMQPTALFIRQEEKWFKGFEKELRAVSKGLKIGEDDFDRGARWAIREILGE